ncbi:hypothetical protein [Caballeronia arationis]|uniref:hypothetical protein n=1 Tax=Caballeronia arationis TaxID=1777142 RepID=UPI00190EBAB4|nr:hypothetical protein [Caballeronia arationis]
MKRSKPLFSVALIPSSPKPRNDGKRMLTLTKKELTVLDQAQPDYEIHLIETEHGHSRWWLMKVKLPTQDMVYDVVTALGKIKLWKRLDIAIDFIKESCPRTQTVCIVFSKRNE